MAEPGPVGLVALLALVTLMLTVGISRGFQSGSGVAAPEVTAPAEALTEVGREDRSREVTTAEQQPAGSSVAVGSTAIDGPEVPPPAGMSASSPEADTGGHSSAATTTTTMPRPGREPVRFAVVGDYGTGSAGAASVAGMIDGRGVDFIVTTGDNVYGDEAIDDVVGRLYGDYVGDYTGGYGPGSPSNRFFPSLGNHDYTDGAGVAGYYDYFDLPGDGFASSSGTERYYDFVWGPVHVFVLDGYVDTGEQRAWLSEQMPRSGAPWQVVVLHFAPYTSSADHGPADWMQWPFGAWGADVVFSGHNHQYERLLVDDGAGEILYLVSGLGGQGTHPFGEAAPGSAVRYNGGYGAVIADACDTGMRLRFLSVSDGVVDRVRLGDGCASGEPEAVPADHDG